jgi:hypothetical protein
VELHRSAQLVVREERLAAAVCYPQTQTFEEQASFGEELLKIAIEDAIEAGL